MTERARFPSLPAIVVLIAATARGATDLPFFGRATFDLTLGAQALDVRRIGALHPYKFDEHSDTPEGFAFDDFSLDSAEGGRRSFLQISARDAGQRDQHFAARAGVFGSWQLSGSFDGFPRLYTTSTRSPFSYLGAGRMAIDEALRRELETVAEPDLHRSAARIFLQSPLTRVGFQRNRIMGSGRWTPLQWLVVRATARDETRQGTRPFSLGSFDIHGTAEQPRFSVLMFEFADPVEVRTDEFTLGTTVRGSAWHVDVDASYSRFRNSITDLDYDNPFRITAAASRDGLTNRLRGARGIAAAVPDNGAKSVRASGHVDVGTRAVVGASITWIGMEQDHRFAPWTLNGAIEGSGLPEGLGPLNIEALPRRSLQGRTNVLATDDSVALVITARTTLTLRYYDYDFTDDTPEIHLPGYASADSLWRTEFHGEPIVPRARGHRSRRAQAELVFHDKALRARLSHERENRSRTQHNVQTEQDTVAAAVQWRGDDFHSAATVRYARRQGLSAADPHTLVPFDAGDRTRADGNVRFQWTASGRLSINGAFSALADDYGAGSTGLQRFATYDGGLDIRLDVFSASALTARLALQSIGFEHALLDGLPSGQGWRRNVNDVSTSTAIDYDTSAGRFLIHLGYERSAAVQSIRIREASEPFSRRPSVTTNLQQVRADVEIEVTPRWLLGLRYRYEPYSLDDYATNDLSPYPLELLSPEVDARRMLLLDARYAGHEAHALMLYFRLTSD